MDTQFEYVFPAIRGVQAGRAYYVSMCPLKLIPRIFLFDEEELAPELRAQRTLNKTRVPEMARYLVENTADYVFSAITASIDSEVAFEEVGETEQAKNVGRLRVPMSAKFVINDGQHRRAAIEVALREKPEIGDETIAVVFFLDRGLSRCQQMFSDLNRYAIRPSRSLNLLYDHRDDGAILAKEIVKRSDCFRGCIEFERSSLGIRSSKLFTLSAIQKASVALLGEHANLTISEQADVAAQYWDQVGAHMPQWNLVREHRLTAGEFRRDFINAHGLALAALGRAGCALLAAQPDDWQERVPKLLDVNWSRSNTEMWEGRAMNAGRILKTRISVLRTTAIVKHSYGLPLSPDELEAEAALTSREVAYAK